MITVRKLVPIAAGIIGVPVHEVMGRGKCRDLRNARWLAMWLSVDVLGNNYALTGRRLGYDHTTVYHAVKRVRRWLVTDPYWLDLTARGRAMVESEDALPSKPVVMLPASEIKPLTPKEVLAGDEPDFGRGRDFLKMQNDRFLAAMRRALQEEAAQ